ncbi:Receptor-like protein 12 [Senna tora]|uniref:Receptor-like protein 12 n=1 Tax=Senna tora TaxID=362788 RepID=A0A835CK49_9FABA|nr:Receptor-like protein 12 [Senna tora]
MRIALISWLLCLWKHLCVHNSVVSAQCLEDQRSLLLQFKNNLTFHYENATKLVSWTENIDCCEWGGVSCDSKGHVVALDLSEQHISAEISSSSSLFSLQYLQDLNLAYNHFSSVIPSAIHNLTNIIHLNFSYAGFSGQIPIEISHLTNLVTLDLSAYSIILTGEEWLKLENPNLGKLVQNLTSITKLYLDGVSISAKGEEWCGALFSLPSLQELGLLDCNLSGPIHSLARLEHLTKIILDANNLSSPVPNTFSNFKNLTTLSLSSCNLRGTFPHNIFQVGTLSFIDISYNEGLHGSLPDFPLHASLNTLIVSNTNFSGPLPNSISNLRQLSTLDLSFCQFSGTLPISMSNLTQLVLLKLSYNRFIGPIPSLNKCKKLIRVILSGNNFTGALPSTHFEGLQNLTDINLHNNSFTGKIPSSLFVLPSMRNILLSNNKFDGELDSFINLSSRIESLELSNNHLEGPIPMSLFQLTQLRDLQLSFNKFSGNIHLNIIQKLGNLNTLDLSYNNLSVIDTKTNTFPSFPMIGSLSLASCKLTTFPKFLKNQSALAHLDLSNNNLMGTIPHWLSNFSHLYHLNLSYNYLTKWEEPLLNNMSSLMVLDVHSNCLQGPLPVLPQLILSYLDYSNNNLSSSIPPNIGNIPESLCNASFLEVLDLSNNSLTGTIPKCLIAMNGTLSILNLRRNKLIGTIDTFPGSCDLRTLDLHGNFLRGKIPKYLATCTVLEILDLGNNQIDDEFPCWLKSISTLHVLIMRSNKFHGSLKCPEYSQVAWSHLQIIDLAFNNFSGIIPPKFFETMKAMMLDQNDGFAFGIGTIFLLLVFWRPWRIWYWKRVETVLYWMFPQLDFVYEYHAGKSYRVLRRITERCFNLTREESMEPERLQPDMLNSCNLGIDNKALDHSVPCADMVTPSKYNCLMLVRF